MDTIALILSIVGCLNWGLVGIFGFDLVAWLLPKGIVQTDRQMDLRGLQESPQLGHDTRRRESDARR